MNNILFDIEVYPNWWCLVHTNQFDMEEFEVITSEDDNFNEKIKKLIHKNVLIGFNIKGYDLRILSAIVDGCDTYRIYEISQAIIKNIDDPYNNYNFWNKFIFSDMYDDWTGSLKEFESNIGLKIVETNVSFDKENLTKEDKKEIIDYCKYDVYALKKLFEYRKKYFEAKIKIAEKFEINTIKALKSTNSKLGALVLGAKKQTRPTETTYIIPKQVNNYITENLPETILHLFKEINDDKKIVQLFNNKVVFGLGGIHSVLSNKIVVKSDENHIIINIDVDSYYPSLMINFDYISRNIINDNNLYTDIVDLKKTTTKDNPDRAIYKDVSNFKYGAMKNKYNALYDPYQASSLSYTGQLLLTALCNKLYNNILDLKIIQTNTDGIIAKININSKDKFISIVQEWEELSGLKMDYSYIKEFYQRDVNDYIAVFENGKYKLKGKWLNQADDNGIANLNAPITHKAILNYYLYDTPIEQTINECDEILQFCFTTKTGHTYDKTYHFIDNQPYNVNKVNRVVATTKTKYGTIKKYKKDKKKYDKIAEIPDNCYLMNGELTMINHLDRMWYINFAKNKIKELKEI